MPQSSTAGVPPGMSQWLANRQGQAHPQQAMAPVGGQQQFPMGVGVPQFAGMQPGPQMPGGGMSTPGVGGGGTVPGVSMDMLQSFIARKNEGQPMQ
jgi:hypothetical protein